MPEKLQSRKARVLVVVGLLIPCLFLSIPAVLAYRAERKLDESFRWVSHTMEVQHHIQKFLRLLIEAESGQRGYLLAAQDQYLDHYRSARERMQKELKVVQELTRDNPAQQERLRDLDALLQVRLDLMDRSISLQKEGKAEEAVSTVREGSGDKAMEAIRTKLREMDQAEAALLTKRGETLTADARFGTELLIALVVLNFLFAVVLFIMFRRLVRVQGLVTVCAWSRTVEYQGEWLSIEEYLLRRFNLNTSHGISPDEAKKAFEDVLPKGPQREG